MNELTEDSFENVGNALVRLKEALEQSANAVVGSLAIDGTIQRFEFCVELFWKLLRRLLSAQKQEVTPLPKPIMQKAYAVGWIHDEKLWLDMLDDRNKTSHTYNQALAKEIYERIKLYYPVMQSTFDTLFNSYSSKR